MSMTLSDTILTMLLDKGDVSIRTLLLCGPTPAVVYKNIRKLLDDKMVSSHRSKMNINGKTVNVNYLSLMRKGFVYLVTHPPEGYEWLGNVPVDKAKSVTIKKHSRCHAWVFAQLNENLVGVMSELSGASVRPNRKSYMDQNEKGDGKETIEHLCEIAKAANPPIPKQTESITTEPKYIRHQTGKEIKALSSSEKCNTAIAADIKRSRCCGSLESETRVVLCYVDHNGNTKWSESAGEYEKDIALWLTRSSEIIKPEHITDNGSSAVLFVSNPSRFRSVFKKTRYNKVGEEQQHPGERFDHFHICPTSACGIEYLRWLMTIDTKAWEKRLIQTAIENGVYREGPNKMFPLSDANGVLYHIGTSFDMSDLRRFQRSMELEPNREYGIVCFEWQSPYYDALLESDISIATVR